MVSAAEQLAANLNFGAFAKAEELKKRIWFTLAALVVYRLGTYIPIPGINPAAFAESFKAQSSGILGMFNMFAGGAVERMAIFASIKHGRHGRNWQRRYTWAWATRLGIYRLSGRTRDRAAHALR